MFNTDFLHVNTTILSSNRNLFLIHPLLKLMVKFICK